MREIALHLLDIAENGVKAGASLIEITVEEDLPNDRLKVAVEDNGQGMDDQLLARVTDPFVTSRTTRKVGLGLPLLKAAAEACRGHLLITSKPGQGTRLDVEFQRSHIDRMPLGDLVGTWLILVVGFPKVHWMFHYRAETQVGQAGAQFTFDDEPIKRELEDVPLTDPSVLAFVRELLEEGVRRVQQAITQSEVNPLILPN
ncbi:MAG: ATP-binding protein [Anaerolineae bacterium]|nr:ATP-binding protein [Anaerolineae bacterium]